MPLDSDFYLTILSLTICINLLGLIIAICYVLYQIDKLVAQIMENTGKLKDLISTDSTAENGQRNHKVSQCKVIQMDNVPLDGTDSDVLYESSKKVKKPLFEANSDYEGSIRSPATRIHT